MGLDGVMMELAREHWSKSDYQEFCGVLASLAEDEYREFAEVGTPTPRPFLGVRMPKQRALAREIGKGNWREFLQHEPRSFEEVNVQGMVIAALPYAQMLEYFDYYLGLVDNWASCDCFCSSLKSVKEHREEFLETRLLGLMDGGEFVARVGLVLLLCYYVDFDYLQVIFEQVDKVKAREEYYVRMAVAWLLCECYVKYPDETYLYLREGGLPKLTLGKTISKICDSFRVPAEGKELVRGLRKA